MDQASHQMLEKVHLQSANQANKNPQIKIQVGGGKRPKHPTSWEWVSTQNPEEKKQWWNDFRAEVLRKYHEHAIHPGDAINESRGFKPHYVIDDNALIDENGDVVDAPPYHSKTLEWPSDNTPVVFTWDLLVGINAEKCFTERLGKKLCNDLGKDVIKWGNYRGKKLSEYLEKIYSILKDNNEMPKVRHRRGNDTASKADERWLKDYINMKDQRLWENPNSQSPVRKMYGDLGDDEESRKATLVQCAIDEEKGKKLHKLLKIKRKDFKTLWDEREQQNAAQQQSVPQMPPANTQMTPIAVQTQTQPPTVVPQIIQPPQDIHLEGHNPHSEVDPTETETYKKNVCLFERITDKINRWWIRKFIYRSDVVNEGVKEQYRQLCGRDWDTGALTR